MTIRELVEQLTNSAGGNLEKRVVLSSTTVVCLDAEEDKWKTVDLESTRLQVVSKHPAKVVIFGED